MVFTFTIDLRCKYTHFLKKDKEDSPQNYIGKSLKVKRLRIFLVFILIRTLIILTVRIHIAASSVRCQNRKKRGCTLSRYILYL